MSLLTIPFLPEFKDKLADGRKTATSRNKKYGQPGDQFQAFGMIFQLEFVLRVPLVFIGRFFVKQEGCKDFNEFRCVWDRIHPIEGYYVGIAKDKRIWLHIFNRVFP